MNNRSNSVFKKTGLDSVQVTPNILIFPTFCAFLSFFFNFELLQYLLLPIFYSYRFNTPK